MSKNWYSKDNVVEITPLIENPGIHNTFALGVEVIVRPEYVQLVFWEDPGTPAPGDEAADCVERAVVTKVVMPLRNFFGKMREQVAEARLPVGVQ